jgi:hypothetical protein
MLKRFQHFSLRCSRHLWDKCEAEGSGSYINLDTLVREGCFRSIEAMWLTKRVEGKEAKPDFTLLATCIMLVSCLA